MVLSQAIGSIVSLGLEGEHMCYIIARVRNNSTVGFFIIIEFYMFVSGNISVYSIGMLMTKCLFPVHRTGGWNMSTTGHLYIL